MKRNEIVDAIRNKKAAPAHNPDDMYCECSECTSPEEELLDVPMDELEAEEAPPAPDSKKRIADIMSRIQSKQLVRK